MGNRIGGTISFSIDGTPWAVRGNMTVTPSSVKREGIAGQTQVDGYTEMPVVPGIKGDFSTVPGLSLSDLQNITDATIQADLANGTSYVLTDAWSVPPFEIDTAGGKFSAEFQGVTCEEI